MFVVQPELRVLDLGGYRMARWVSLIRRGTESPHNVSLEGCVSCFRFELGRLGPKWLSGMDRLGTDDDWVFIRLAWVGHLGFGARPERGGREWSPMVTTLGQGGTSYTWQRPTPGEGVATVLELESSARPPPFYNPQEKL